MSDFSKLKVHLDDPDRVDELRRIESLLVEHAFPPQLVVENTSHCNLTCIHCSHAELTRPKRHMARELWNKVVEEVGSKSPTCELWPTFYGEALLLRDELWDRLRYAADVGCENLVLNSNGTLLKARSYIDQVLDSPLKRFILSLDGLSKETFEKIREKASWEETYPFVEELCRRRRERGQVYPVIIAQFSVMKENAHEVEAFREYWTARGAEVKFRPMLEWTASGSIRTDTIAHDRSFRIACPWANNTMAIHQDGSVVTCAVDWAGRFSVGNVADASIEELWRRLGERLRKPHREHRWDQVPEICRGCGDWQVAGAEYDEEKVEGTRPFWHQERGSSASPTAGDS